MSRFAVYAFNPMSGARIGEFQKWTDFTYTDGLFGEGSGSVEVAWWDEIASTVIPGAHGIAIDEDGVLRWSGWVQMRRVDPSRGTVRYGLDSWWSYYDRRWLRSRTGMSNAETSNVGPQDIKWIDVDMFDIVEDMVDHAASVAGAASIGLTLRKLGPGTGGISGVDRQRTFYSYERKRIADAVEDLASQYGGFDFAVVSQWDKTASPWEVIRYLDLNYPRRGVDQTSTAVLEHGSNVSLLSLTEDATEQANPIVAVGSGSGDAQLTAEATDASYRYPLGPYPYVEGEVRYRDEGTEYAGNLERLSQTGLAINRSPLITAEATITETRETKLGSVGTGDSMRTVAEFGDFSFDETLRVMSQTVQADSGGLKQWKISLAENAAALGLL